MGAPVSFRGQRWLAAMVMVDGEFRAGLPQVQKQARELWVLARGKILPLLSPFLPFRSPICPYR